MSRAGSEPATLPSRGVAAALLDPALPLRGTPQPSVLESFVRIVAADPERLAVVHGERRWSYAELSRRAHATCRALLAAGTAPGEVVAIEGWAGPELAAALLGVVAAGAVMLVLDERLPQRRVERMLAVAGAKRLLRLRHRRPLPWELDLAILPPAAAGEADGVLELERAARARRSDAAYVFFTSGSSAEPKAVLGSHAGLAHFLAWQRGTYALCATDRCAQLTQLSFDVVLRDVFLPLTSGASLHFPAADAFEHPSHPLDWLGRERITSVHLVPSVTTRWLAVRRERAPYHGLRLAFFAGEPLSAALVQEFRRAFPAARILNLYGPTETTLAKCAGEVPDPPRPGVQAVGLPLPDTQVWVCDALGALLEPNQVGELAIRTPYRSLGYLGLASRQERFRINPFTRDPNDLVYFTGDRGRRSADGTIEVLGRLDHEFKVRGVRVQPVEIEAALEEIPGVRRAAVAAAELSPGDRQLVAYLVLDDSSRQPGDVRRALADLLPAHLLPTLFLALPELPLTPNGKLARAALPDPGALLARRAPPRWDSHVQAELARAWQAVLGHAAFGADDDFLTVGGDSIKVVALCAAVTKTFGVPAGPAALLEQATVRAQARWLELARAPAGAPARPSHTVFGEGRLQKLFAFPPLLGFGLAYHALSGFVPSHAFYCFDFFEDADPVGRYLAEIQRIQPRGPLALIGYSAGGNLAFDVAARLHREGRAVRVLIQLESRRFVTPEFLSDAEIERILWANLDGLSGLMYSDERFRVFVEDDGLRRSLASKMRAFLRYECGRTNDGPVHTDLHFICSEEQRVCDAWAEVTRGKFVVHAGAGRHVAMGHGDNARINGQVIAEILSDACLGAEPLPAAQVVEGRLP